MLKVEHLKKTYPKSDESRLTIYLLNCARARFSDFSDKTARAIHYDKMPYGILPFA